MRGILSIDHSQYYVAEPGAFEYDDLLYRGGNGLVNVRAGFAVILTGTAMGNIDLTVGVTRDVPDLESDQWEEIVEVSVHFDTPEASIANVEWDRNSFPVVSSAGPGWYRLRVHAKGRDEGLKRTNVAGDPVESHLLSVWPAPEQSEIVHKSTDQCGAMIRARV